MRLRRFCAAADSIGNKRKRRCRKVTFKQLFFRYYDKKVTSGEISFSRTGIRKDEFTRLCTEEDFVFDRQTLEQICTRMNLTEEETQELFEAAGRLWKK